MYDHYYKAAVSDVDRRAEDDLAMQDLSRFDCLTIPEIAVRLNLSEKTVQYHLANALRELRTHLRG